MGEIDTAPQRAAGPPAAGPARPARRPGPGMKPALVVLGIAVAIMALFGVGAALSNSGPGDYVRQPATPLAVPGTPLRAVPAGPALAPIVSGGSPPANVVAALAVPVGVRAVGVTEHSQNASQYDKAMRFAVPGSQGAVIAFYRAELGRLGWHRSSTGPAAGRAAIEVLAEKAGNDGWQWEVGVVVSPTAFGAGGTETTPFSLRLFQVPDSN